MEPEGKAKVRCCSAHAGLCQGHVSRGLRRPYQGTFAAAVSAEDGDAQVPQRAGLASRNDLPQVRANRTAWHGAMQVEQSALESAGTRFTPPCSSKLSYNPRAFSCVFACGSLPDLRSGLPLCNVGPITHCLAAVSRPGAWWWAQSRFVGVPGHQLFFFRGCLPL